MNRQNHTKQREGEGKRKGQNLPDSYTITSPKQFQWMHTSKVEVGLISLTTQIHRLN